MVSPQQLWLDLVQPGNLLQGAVNLKNQVCQQGRRFDRRDRASRADGEGQAAIILLVFQSGMDERFKKYRVGRHQNAAEVPELIKIRLVV
ncbi:hypothetical protein SDC9_205172 [bioreactor metagenome]|uniref:Uncharacterized protein n=1 Tax=bioreactor metagenome TaxID=1076179 RepID=A0A645J1C3_9ZZZZ